MWLNPCRLKQMHTTRSLINRLKNAWTNGSIPEVSPYDGLITPENGIQHGKIEHEICKQRC